MSLSLSSIRSMTVKPEGKCTPKYTAGLSSLLRYFQEEPERLEVHSGPFLPCADALVKGVHTPAQQLSTHFSIRASCWSMKCLVSGDSSYLLMYSPQYGALLFPLFRRRGGVINNTACRQRGKHRRGVETEDVHACIGISPSLLLSAAAHLAIRNVLCALFCSTESRQISAVFPSELSELFH